MIDVSTFQLHRNKDLSFSPTAYNDSKIVRTIWFLYYVVS